MSLRMWNSCASKRILTLWFWWFTTTDSIYLLVHLGWYRRCSCLVNLFRQGWFLVQDLATVHTCRWSLIQRTPYSMRERPGVKGKTSREKISVSSCPFWLIWRTFVTKHETLPNRSHQSRWLWIVWWGGKKVLIVNDNCVLFHCLLYLSATFPLF